LSQSSLTLPASAGPSPRTLGVTDTTDVRLANAIRATPPPTGPHRSGMAPHCRRARSRSPSSGAPCHVGIIRAGLALREVLPGIMGSHTDTDSFGSLPPSRLRLVALLGPHTCPSPTSWAMELWPCPQARQLPFCRAARSVELHSLGGSHSTSGRTERTHVVRPKWGTR
jgi:hypothetical protein